MNTHTMIAACRTALTSRLTLCAVAILGAISLHHMAEQLQKQPPIRDNSNPGIVKLELLAIHAPQKLIQFAREHRSFENNEELSRAMEAAHLQGYWYAMDIGYAMEDGTVDILTSVARPGEHYFLFPSVMTVLKTLGGDPPIFKDVDFHTAKIDVIDESFMSGDPMQTMEDFLEIQLAHHSRPASASYHLGLHLAHSRMN